MFDTHYCYNFWTENPYGFKTGDRSTTSQNNLVKFGLRWYLPATGSWTQQDTLDTPLNPSNANRYAYVADDPILQFDEAGGVVLIAAGIAEFVYGLRKQSAP